MSDKEQHPPNILTREGETVIATVIHEQLNVEKRVVDTGVVRARKLVHEDLVTVDIPLAREVAEIIRVKVDQVVPGPVPVRYEGDVMIVPVMEERLVSYTELVLVEEIHITRREVKQSAREEVMVRREEIVVERLDPDGDEWRLVKDVPSTDNT